MNSSDTFLSNVQDHIMANTWRLIFEHRHPCTDQTRPTSLPPSDFSRLELVLPEYRLMGREMVGHNPLRYQ